MTNNLNRIAEFDSDTVRTQDGFNFNCHPHIPRFKSRRTSVVGSEPGRVTHFLDFFIDGAHS
jgi:hypothetical protein